MKRAPSIVGLALILAGPLTCQATEETPAQLQIKKARQSIASSPNSPQPRNDLAMALARRARETSDPTFYAQALEEIGRSLTVAPDNFDALKTKAWVLLGQHDFAAARELATSLNKRAPDDVMVYGLLTDANTELGNYAEAERACQWMLDIRPGNVPALTRAAYLRELFGDVTGALELMAQALDQVPLSETEDRAWILTQIGHLHLTEGRLAPAEAALEQALTLFPEYHYALGQLARVRTAQRRHADAALLLRRRQATADHPENLYELAEALERAGRTHEARRTFREFETGARREMEGTDNANRELVFYYVDHAGRPQEALRIAAAEAARRHDVYTLEAHAWALQANGKSAEALRQIDTALAVGVRDPRILRHALAIARKAGHRLATARFQRELAALSPVDAPKTVSR
jgi:tetratricopeptide (TPR) repeat protein